MTIQEFRQEMATLAFVAKKRKGFEVFDVSRHGVELFCVTYAELHPLTDVHQLLAKKLRPEYMPPLG